MESRSIQNDTHDGLRCTSLSAQSFCVFCDWTFSDVKLRPSVGRVHDVQYFHPHHSFQFV